MEAPSIILHLAVCHFTHPACRPMVPAAFGLGVDGMESKIVLDARIRALFAFVEGFEVAEEAFVSIQPCSCSPGHSGVDCVFAECRVHCRNSALGTAPATTAGATPNDGGACTRSRPRPNSLETFSNRPTAIWCYRHSLGKDRTNDLRYSSMVDCVLELLLVACQQPE